MKCFKDYLSEARVEDLMKIYKSLLITTMNYHKGIFQKNLGRNPKNTLYRMYFPVSELRGEGFTGDNFAEVLSIVDSHVETKGDKKFTYTLGDTLIDQKKAYFDNKAYRTDNKNVSVKLVKFLKDIGKEDVSDAYNKALVALKQKSSTFDPKYIGASGETRYIVISRNWKDYAKQSEDREWKSESCKALSGSFTMNCHHIPTELNDGWLCAFMITDTAYNSKFPLATSKDEEKRSNVLARVLIVPYEGKMDARGKKKIRYWVSANSRVYPAAMASTDFRNLVQKAVDIAGFNDGVPEGIYNISRRGYTADNPDTVKKYDEALIKSFRDIFGSRDIGSTALNKSTLEMTIYNSRLVEMADEYLLTPELYTIKYKYQPDRELFNDWFKKNTKVEANDDAYWEFVKILKDNDEETHVFVADKSLLRFDARGDSSHAILGYSNNWQFKFDIFDDIDIIKYTVEHKDDSDFFEKFFKLISNKFKYRPESDNLFKSTSLIRKFKLTDYLNKYRPTSDSPDSYEEMFAQVLENFYNSDYSVYIKIHNAKQYQAFLSFCYDNDIKIKGNKENVNYPFIAYSTINDEIQYSQSKVADNEKYFYDMNKYEGGGTGKIFDAFVNKFNEAIELKDIFWIKIHTEEQLEKFFHFIDDDDKFRGYIDDYKIQVRHHDEWGFKIYTNDGKVDSISSTSFFPVDELIIDMNDYDENIEEENIDEDFKIGDRVALITNNWPLGNSNPILGTEYQTLGTVTELRLPGIIEHIVEWDNGTRNGYNRVDLKKYKFKVGDRVTFKTYDQDTELIVDRLEGNGVYFEDGRYSDSSVLTLYNHRYINEN